MSVRHRVSAVSCLGNRVVSAHERVGISESECPPDVDDYPDGDRDSDVDEQAMYPEHDFLLVWVIAPSAPFDNMTARSIPRTCPTAIKSRGHRRPTGVRRAQFAQLRGDVTDWSEEYYLMEVEPDVARGWRLWMFVGPVCA